MTREDSTSGDAQLTDIVVFLHSVRWVLHQRQLSWCVCSVKSVSQSSEQMISWCFTVSGRNPVVLRVWLQSPPLSQNTCTTSATSFSPATLKYTSFTKVRLPLCAFPNTLTFPKITQTWEIRPHSKVKEANSQSKTTWCGSILDMDVLCLSSGMCTCADVCVHV